jgi:hypothetical protein
MRNHSGRAGKGQFHAIRLSVWLGFLCGNAAAWGGVHDPRLREDLRLLHDPSLVEPTDFPWATAIWSVIVLLGAVLVWLRLRRRQPVAVTAGAEEPVEDALGALERAWRGSSERKFNETITTFAAILRRYLTRKLAVDCTTTTTADLRELFAHRSDPALAVIAAEELGRLRREFFCSADEARFAGGDATILTVRKLYEIARDFITSCEEQDKKQMRTTNGGGSGKPKSAGEASVPPAQSLNAQGT